MKNIQQQINKIATQDSTYTVNELRMIFAAERVVARLQAHPKTQQAVIFKGGFVLLKTTQTERFTRDLDATILGIAKDRIPQLINSAISTELNDGIWFGKASSKEMLVGGNYGGYRFSVPFQIGEPPKSLLAIKKLSHFTVDIGIGDSVTKDVGGRMSFC